jgi:hypothetical protein
MFYDAISDGSIGGRSLEEKGKMYRGTASGWGKEGMKAVLTTCAWMAFNKINAPTETLHADGRCTFSFPNPLFGRGGRAE